MPLRIFKRNDKRSTKNAAPDAAAKAAEARSSRDWAGAHEGVVFLGQVGAVARSGVRVTPETALQASAVLGCIGRIARDLSTLPLQLLDAEGQVVKDHPVARLLRSPSPYHVPAALWQAYVINLLSWGNGHASIEFARDGVTPVGLLPLMARDVDCRRTNGQLIYRIDGFRAALPAERVLHTPYLALDGVAGQSPIRLARDVIGTGMALDEFAARFFSNGGNTGTFFELPKMSRDALAETQRHIRETYTGLENSHNVLAIPEAKPHKVGTSPRDAQAIEARDFQLREIARVFNMPVGILDPEKSKYAGLESQYQDYAQATLRPIAVLIEQELERKLLAENEQGQLTIRWNLDAMVRASLEDRAAADTSLVSGGVMTPNEARAHHNLRPVPGGDALLVPLNMAKAADDDSNAGAGTDTDTDEARHDAGESDIETRAEPDPRVEQLVRSIAAGVATKEANAARKAAKSRAGFPDWAAEWFSDHRAHLKQRLPTVDEARAAAVADHARDQLLAAHAAGDLDAVLDAWPQTRPDSIARLSLVADPDPEDGNPPSRAA